MPNTKKLREKRMRLVHAQGGKCAYCGKPFVIGGFRYPTLDHVTPRALGGSNVGMENFVAACADCNTAKGHMSAEAFRAKLRDGQDQAEGLRRALRRSVAAIGERPSTPTSEIGAVASTGERVATPSPKDRP